MEIVENIRRVTRAWVLVQAVDAEGVAQRIYGLNAGLAWPAFHVVRTDVVDGPDRVNIVVPVWAPDPKAVGRIDDMIRGLEGVERTQIAMVRPGEKQPLHHPFPPHKALGLVTDEEANPSARPLGFNGWG
jgi:hypothetical protein